MILGELAALDAAVLMEFDAGKQTRPAGDALHDRIFRREKASQLSTAVESRMDSLVAAAAAAEIPLHFIIIREGADVTCSVAVVRVMYPGVRWQYGAVVCEAPAQLERQQLPVIPEMYPALFAGKALNGVVFSHVADVITAAGLMHLLEMDAVFHHIIFPAFAAIKA